VRPDKPWFGPSPITRNPFFPLRWEGWVAIVAFLLGTMLLRLEPDLVRRGFAEALVMAAFCAIVILTWGDPDSDGLPHWRETLFNRQTLVWLGVLLVLGAAIAAAGLTCRGCSQRPVPGWHAGARPLR